MPKLIFNLNQFTLLIKTKKHIPNDQQSLIDVNRSTESYIMSQDTAPTTTTMYPFVKSEYTFYEEDYFDPKELRFIRINYPKNIKLIHNSPQMLYLKGYYFSSRFTLDGKFLISLKNPNDYGVSVKPEMTVRFALATGLLTTGIFELDNNIPCNYEMFDVDLGYDFIVKWDENEIEYSDDEEIDDIYIVSDSSEDDNCENE